MAAPLETFFSIMPSNVPDKTTVACDNPNQAMMTTAMALADAARQKSGANLETTFPEGRMRLVIGEITVSVGQPPRKEGGSPRG